MAVGFIEIVVGVLAVLIFFYHYLTRNYDFWNKRHIVGPKPTAFFGNFKDVFLGKVNPADSMKSIYNAYYEEQVIGLFYGTEPVLIVKDLNMIKDVLIKSFSTFADRGFKVHEDIDPLSQHLVFLEPSRWKPLRKKLTPVFTSGKLKEMFYLINECADQFVEYLDKEVAESEPIECRELTAKFTTDVIGVCAFGLNMNAISNEDSEFRKIGRRIFENSWLNRVWRDVGALPHWLVKLLKSIARDDKTINFFVNMMKETMENRKKNNVRRNDFVDLLMDIREHSEKDGEEKMTDISLTAQAFVFFIAGFETSSATLSHAMYELALNPDIQTKLREEVKMTLEQNQGKLTYDSVKDMKYLDKVVKETLRKYPPLFALSRKTMEDHTFVDSKISIPKGVSIIIPVYAIHHDPNIYPEPDKFDPDRFGGEFENTRHPMSFIPFGEGPRNCIGDRFGKSQTIVGLVRAIQHFKFEVCEKTCIPYVKSAGAKFLTPKDGLYLRIRKNESLTKRIL